MDYRALYREKIRTPEEAVKLVKDGDWVDYSQTCSFPQALDRALAARSGELRDVKLRAARTKKEFDNLKADYDDEFKEMNERLTAAKAVAEERAKAISQPYLDKYQTIKRHSFPPLARMIGSQCTGCAPSL